MSILHFGKGNNGNAIVHPVTPDKLNDGSHSCGFDQHGQLWVRWHDRLDPDCITGTIVADVRAKSCPICQRGWDNTTASLRNQTYIHSMERHAHTTCMNGFGHIKNFFRWHHLFCEQPMNKEGFDWAEIPNEYGSSWTGPWYRVTYKHLAEFPIVVGTRKRVDNVEVVGVTFQLEELFKEAFKNEDVTKSMSTHKLDGEDKPSWLIHAWTDEKAKEYVEKIVAILVAWKEKQKPEPVLPAQS
jgi:hypothetical protein